MHDNVVKIPQRGCLDIIVVLHNIPRSNATSFCNSLLCCCNVAMSAIIYVDAFLKAEE